MNEFRLISCYCGQVTEFRLKKSETSRFCYSQGAIHLTKNEGIVRVQSTLLLNIASVEVLYPGVLQLSRDLYKCLSIRYYDQGS